MSFEVMSFSPIYQYLIQNSKAANRRLFFEQLTSHLQRMRIKDRYLWMYDYIHVLECHCRGMGNKYYVSKRSADHFVQSLDRLRSYNDVDNLCLYIYFRHVCYRCACRNC